MPYRMFLGRVGCFFWSPPLPLPPLLRDAVDRLSVGPVRHDLAHRSADLSAAYRARRSSVGLASREDVLAYLLTRMPATYAAVDVALARLTDALPDFVPRSLLDLGCGPGTASWAAAEAFPSLAATTMLDTNGALLSAARDLAASHRLLSGAAILQGTLSAPPPGPFDLVVASYALTEVADPAAIVAPILHACAGALVIVEPGTPRDWRRLMGVRDRLLRLGATIAAPCPHHHACPVAEPDWCHFSVRLERSREHLRLKRGTLGYEDEKFVYLIVTKQEMERAARPARILARPERSKFDIRLKLCTPAGACTTRAVPKRDAAAFRAARKLDWGDETTA